MRDLRQGKRDAFSADVPDTATDDEFQVFLFVCHIAANGYVLPAGKPASATRLIACSTAG